MAISMAMRQAQADDFVRSIQAEEGFTHITNVAQLQAGDVIAWEFALEDDKREVTGHVMLIDQVRDQMAS